MKAASFFGAGLSLFLFVATQRAHGLTKDCCQDNSLARAASTAEFAQAHPLKIAYEVPALRGTMVRLVDFGTDDVAYLTLPEQQPLGGVVVLHEWWGLNDYMKATADQWAQAGFITLAVDLYNGQVATDPGQAADLMHNLREASAIQTINSAVRFLRESPRFRAQRVGTIGWCMGGGLSLQAALQVKGVDAAVMYYGPVELDEKKLAKLHAPILGLFAEKDTFVLPDDVRHFAELMKAANKNLDLHWFDAPHAFANPSNEQYRPELAAETWQLSLDFLKRELSPPVPEKNLFQKVFN